MRIATYCRVSSSDGSQDTENQITALRAFCAAAKDPIVREYIDHASAKSGDRAQFKALMLDATRRKFDAVLVWALDRFTREGIEETFGYIRKLKENGVDFISYSEPHFRTTGPAGSLMLSIAAWIAQQERIRISERTKAGLARVKASGKALGRRWVGVDRAKLKAMRQSGLAVREIAEELGISRSVAHRALVALDLGGPRPDRSSVRAAKAAAARGETPESAILPTPAPESALHPVEVTAPEIPIPSSPVQDRAGSVPANWR